MVDSMRWTCRIPLTPDSLEAYRLELDYLLHTPWEATPQVGLWYRSGAEESWQILAADLSGAEPDSLRLGSWDLLHTDGALELELRFDLRSWPASVWNEPVMTIRRIRIHPISEAVPE